MGGGKCKHSKGHRLPGTSCPCCCESRTHPQDVRPQLGPGEGVRTFREVARKSLSQVQRAGAGAELSISGCYCRGREPPSCGDLATPVRSTQE